MKSLPKVLIFLLSVSISVGTILYFFFPDTTFKIASQQRAMASNLIKGQKTIKGYNITFYSSISASKKDTLILLHGLADRKEGFLKMVKYLSKDYHIIIPDLPGHGDNIKDETLDYRIQNQIYYLKDLFDQLKLDKYHICGISTGGLFGIYFSSLYPKQVKSLTIVNTPFINDSSNPFFNKFLEEIGENLNIISCLDLVFYKRPKFSWPITNRLQKQLRKDLEFLTRKNIIKNIFILPKSILSSLRTPVLILHSPQDKLLPVEDAKKYHEIIPNSIYGTLKESGHYPQYEKPSFLSAGIRGQIERNSTRKLD